VKQVRDSILRKHPEWADYVDTLEGGDLEIAVPAPPRSRAKHLVIFTSRGDDIWVRYAPPRMCYSVERGGGSAGPSLGCRVGASRRASLRKTTGPRHNRGERPRSRRRSENPR
jgi:hypothetical protein